jgi:MFS family permease
VESDRRTTSGAPALLRLRDFRLIFLSTVLSSFGDYVALVALTIRVHDLTQSGLAVSALLVSGLLPLVVFAPLAGLLVDRVETTRLLWVTSLAQAAIAAALAFTEALPLVLLLSFLLGTGFALVQPALFAAVPRAVGEERTTPANASLEVARWSGASIGPLAGGALAAAAGTKLALLADAATFLVVAAGMASLRLRRRPGSEDVEEAGADRGMREGIAFVARQRLLRLTFVVLGASVLFAAIDNVAEVFFAKNVLGAGDLGYGGLIAAWTVGMVVVSLWLGRKIPPERLGVSVMLGATTVGAAVAMAAAFPAIILALAMFFLGGGANAIENVAMRSLIHHRTPDRLRGRVFSAYYGMVHAAHISALGLGGLLVNAIGARYSLLVAGLGGLLIGLVGFVFLARMPDGSEEGPGGVTARADGSRSPPEPARTDRAQR